MTDDQRMPRRSVLESVGFAATGLALAGLVVSAVLVGAGDEASILGLIASFAAGTTGVGLAVAGREAAAREAVRSH